MRIVATSDTHFPITEETMDLIPSGDVLIHAGDLMYTGYPDEWNALVEGLARLPHKTKILVPGNHDFHIQNYNGIARAELRRRANVQLFDNGMFRLGELSILAVPFVTGLNGWAYSVEEEGMARYLELACRGNVPDIVVSHGPMYKVLDAINPDAPHERTRQHVGSWALKHWFDSLLGRFTPPKVFIHGHIHESYGTTGYEGCTFYNVAMCDRKYDQVNPGVVIDV